MRWIDIPYMVTGFSTAVFGVSWTPPPNARAIVRNLVVFLEDRRCLYNQYVAEDKEAVRVSVDKIRDELTKTVQLLPERSETIPLLQEMRAASRRYMDNAYDAVNSSYETTPTYQFFQALGGFRSAIGERIHRLCLMYGIDLNDELASTLLPHIDEEASSTTPRKQGAREES
ncbi:DUF6650 family protein [Methylibium rhizosphaerae]|uniref:DUF6650 family protein n=1 Tax=Methylibium rhizosphaerae TaxID=2570323 RepID=UPI00112746DC|nr:DUF6650 family protein [Methylibium rhizosphaerae]